MSRPLNITIALGPFYPTPPAPTGAVQRIWSDLADEFGARGHEVTILACRHSGQAADESRGNITVRRRTSLRQGKNVYVDIIKDAWYSSRATLLMPRADVVVSNAFWFPVFAARRQQTRGRLMVHVARAPKGQLRFYKGAACFDTPSEAIREQIVAEAPWAASRTKVVPGNNRTSGPRPTLILECFSPQSARYTLTSAGNPPSAFSCRRYAKRPSR